MSPAEIEAFVAGEVKEDYMEGCMEVRLSVVENALRKNMSLSLPGIAELTGLSLAEVEAMAARLSLGGS